MNKIIRKLYHLKPEIVSSLKHYKPNDLLKDLNAGLLVGFIAIPLALAFSIAVGAKPEIGLLTAVVGGFIVCLLGGSKFQIAGPTGAFIVIIQGIVSTHGFPGLIIATLMAGIILAVLGLFKFGNIIKFIPHPIIIGFTAGISILIIASQIPDLLGLSFLTKPHGVIETMKMTFEHIESMNFISLLTAIISILILIFGKKIFPKTPLPIIILAIIIIIQNIYKLPIETIGSKFGSFELNTLQFSFPNMASINISNLILPALSIAMLGSIESLLSAIVADEIGKTQHNPNSELWSQGLANISVSFFGGIPVTGAIARTGANIHAGARSPVAGIIHCLVILIALVFLGSFISVIPLCLLSSILLIVAFKMGEFKKLFDLREKSKTEILILLATFFLTIFTDLTIAIPVGIMIAIIGAIQAHVRSARIRVSTNNYFPLEHELGFYNSHRIKLPSGVSVIDIVGPLFFASIPSIELKLRNKLESGNLLIINLNHISSIDSNGVNFINKLSKNSKQISFFKNTEKAVFNFKIYPNILESIRSISLDQNTNPLDKLIKSSRIIEYSKSTKLAECLTDAIASTDLDSESKQVYLKALIERELFSPTAIGHGIAFPHPFKQFENMKFNEKLLIIKSKTALDFETPDDIPVHCVFLIFSTTYNEHLEILSFIAEKIKNNSHYINELHTE